MVRQADSLIAVMLCTLLRQWLGNELSGLDPCIRIFNIQARRQHNPRGTAAGASAETPSKEGSRSLDSYIRPAPGALTDKSASAPSSETRAAKTCSTSPVPQNFLTCAALTLVTSPAAGANVSSRRSTKTFLRRASRHKQEDCTMNEVTTKTTPPSRKNSRNIDEFATLPS